MRRISTALFLLTILSDTSALAQLRSSSTAISMHAEVRPMLRIKAQQSQMNYEHAQIAVRNLRDDQLEIVVLLDGTDADTALQVPIAISSNVRSFLLKSTTVDSTVVGSVSLSSEDTGVVASRYISRAQTLSPDRVFALGSMMNSGSSDRALIELGFHALPAGEKREVRIQVKMVPQGV